MCDFCEKEATMMQIKSVNISMLQWCGETKAKDLSIFEDDLGVFIDTRGYVRLVDLDDCQCLDGGEKIKIHFCPFCGVKINHSC